MTDTIYLDHLSLCDNDICIEKLEYKDITRMIEIRNLCRDYLHNNSEFSVREAQRWFDALQSPYFRIMKGNQMVGYIRTDNWDLSNKRCEIGLDVHPDFQNQGVGTTAYKLLFKYLFKELKFHKVTLEVLAFNKRAIQLYFKLGFKLEGVKKHDILRSNRWIDSLEMALLDHEWLVQEKFGYPSSAETQTRMQELHYGI